MMRTGFFVALLISSMASAAAAQPAQTDTTKKKDLPLPAARSVDLDTDEGTWISVDVSPNGSTVVFDMLGDLYTVPFAGGNATQITSGMSFDAQPRYSPDGNWVTFTSDRDGS